MQLWKYYAGPNAAKNANLWTPKVGNRPMDLYRSAVSSARSVLFSPGAQFDLKRRKQARMGDRWKRPFETDSDHRKSDVRYDHRDDEWGAWGYWGRNKADDQSGSEEDVSSIQAPRFLIYRSSSSCQAYYLPPLLTPFGLIARGRAQTQNDDSDMSQPHE